MKAPPEAWRIVDHVCRFCGGRVLQDGDDFRCSGCAMKSRGHPRGVCGCGLIPRGMTEAQRRNPAYRCAPNPDRGPRSPAEIVILYAGQPADAK